MRRRLVIRRYGALSFGLGYLEDGIWVDHTTVPASAVEEDAATAAVHAALGCCVDRDALLSTVPIVRSSGDGLPRAAGQASRLAP